MAEQNASRADAMGQYATSEANKISALNAQNQVSVEKANADRASVLNKFNSQLEDQRQRFMNIYGRVLLEKLKKMKSPGRQQKEN